MKPTFFDSAQDRLHQLLTVSEDAVLLEQQDPVVAELRHIFLSLAAMLSLTALVFVFQVPNPNMILISGLTVLTSLFGYGSGIASGVVMLVYSLYFFSTDHCFVAFTAINVQKMTTIFLGVVLNIVFIGHLKQVNRSIQRQLLEMNRSLRSDNRNLSEASLHDALTQVRNRSALTRDYDGYCGLRLHVMMLDLDDFKQVNDTHGHAVGDYVLQQTGHALVSCFGAHACYRYGGDEFLVVCADQNLSQFERNVDQLLDAVRGIALDGQPLRPHISAGSVSGRSELPCDLRLMLHQADQNLYESKRMGKDCHFHTDYDRVLAESLGEGVHQDTSRSSTLH